MAQQLKIDFIADVVCPWCYIGWARLKAALALRPDIAAEVTWRPYQLDPTLPEEGVYRAAYMGATFPDPEKRRAAMQALNTFAAEDGLDLKLSEIPMSPNTNAAHRLIRWAQGQGRQQAAVEAVMHAYFTELRDIGDPVVLAEIAEAIGMDRMTVLKLLSEGADTEAITREHVTAWRAGVRGVPFTIFDGRVAVSGAESAEHLAAAMDKALEPAA